MVNKDGGNAKIGLFVSVAARMVDISVVILLLYRGQQKQAK
jgi:hypothetical protein